MTVHEDDLPGVGRKYELDTGNETVIVVERHNGDREIYTRQEPTTDTNHLLTLSATDATRLGHLLTNTSEDSTDTDHSAPLGNLRIEWHKVSDDARIVGDTVDDITDRDSSTISVAAIHRDDRTLPTPAPDTEINPGDILITVGDHEAHETFATYLE